MEDSQKVRQMTQKEVSQIDANQVAYYTLTDGTIVKIKKFITRKKSSECKHNGSKSNESTRAKYFIKPISRSGTN